MPRVPLGHAQAAVRFSSIHRRECGRWPTGNEARRTECSGSDRQCLLPDPGFPLPNDLLRFGLAGSTVDMASCVMTIRSVACACSAKSVRMALTPSLARQEFARPNVSMPDSEITRAPSAYRHPPRLTGDGRQADSQCIQRASARQRWHLSSTRAKRRPSTKIQAAIGHSLSRVATRRAACACVGRVHTRPYSAFRIVARLVPFRVELGRHRARAGMTAPGPCGTS